MFKKLRLKNFKNFQEAELALGPLTLLVGMNASGKSNVRDAFRFLHGIGRGYTLADILGTKHDEAGNPQWGGMRSGIGEVTFQGAPTFALEASFTVDYKKREQVATYRIEIEPSANGGKPRIIHENLELDGYGFLFFETEPSSNPNQLRVVARSKPGKPQYISLQTLRPVLPQLAEQTALNREVRSLIRASLDALSNMRFLDLSPELMRLPSPSGEHVLRDRGENLSSVLQSICEDSLRKQILVQWLQELTPMDAVDLEFQIDPLDPHRRVTVTLLEGNGQRIKALSASDGTLRFLGMLAALLSPEPAGFYFVEELENGIHPTRLHLLVQLIEQQVSQGKIQVAAITHSPQLLRLISPDNLAFAALTYRLEGHAHAQIKRILDIPEARRIIEGHDLGQLYESGWLENSVAFLEDEEIAA
jgi:predicted ATPase